MQLKGESNFGLGFQMIRIQLGGRQQELESNRPLLKHAGCRERKQEVRKHKTINYQSSFSVFTYFSKSLSPTDSITSPNRTTESGPHIQICE